MPLISLLSEGTVCTTYLGFVSTLRKSALDDGSRGKLLRALNQPANVEMYVKKVRF